jgi:hypothetical protein
MLSNTLWNHIDLTIQQHRWLPYRSKSIDIFCQYQSLSIDYKRIDKELAIWFIKILSINIINEETFSNFERKQNIIRNGNIIDMRNSAWDN